MTGSSPSSPTGDAAGAPSRGCGLSDAEAARRLASHGANEVATARQVSTAARVAAQVRDPLIIVLLAAVVLTVVIGDHPDAVVIALVVIVNTAVGTVQEARADRAVAALSALSAPKARVMRSNVEQEVAARTVVPGDVLVLAEGDVVPADATVQESAALLVDESAVTGESVPVEKSPRLGPSPARRETAESHAADETGLLAGTVVVRGRGLASVTATGAESALGRIAVLLQARPGPTPLQNRLASLGRVLAVVAVVLCALVFLLGVLRGQPVAAGGAAFAAARWYGRERHVPHVQHVPPVQG